MPLQSWSKKVREQDFNLPWAFQIGRDPAATTAGQVTIYALKGSDSGSSSTNILNTSITATTEDVSSLFPGDPEFGSGAGQIIRGIHSFDIPTESSDASKFNINERYGLRIENTGTTSVTVFNCFRSFIKRYPTEMLDSADTTGLGLSAQDEADYTAAYINATTTGTLLNLIETTVDTVLSRHPAPSALVTAFTGLSGSSTTSEIDAVLTSSDFRTYYGSDLPVATIPPAVYTWQTSSTNPVSLPFVLAPGETLTVGLTKEIAEFFHHPFAINL